MRAAPAGPAASDADLLAVIADALPPRPGGHICVAVSGGGDSVALLHLMVRACRDRGMQVSAVTVDHRLRPGSAGEAAEVAALCRALRVRHETLAWDHGKIAGNLMEAARNARMSLIAQWARGQGVDCIALGHTADDQAETFLMALSRASGLDGLIGLRPTWQAEGALWSRPLLGTTRADLRTYLRRHGIPWAEDPTNDDPRFERVRARRVMAALAPLGIDAGRIGRTQGHLRDAKRALDEALALAVAAHVADAAGALRVDRAGFGRLPRDLQRQLLNAAVAWVSGIALPPRAEKQVNLLAAAREGREVTVHGCRLRHQGDRLLLAREFRAVAALDGPTDVPWDLRWHLEGPHDPALALRALGPGGLRACPDWRRAGLPREVLIATPAVWRGETLVAAPLAGWPQGWTAKVSPSFAATFEAH